MTIQFIQVTSMLTCTRCWLIWCTQLANTMDKREKIFIHLLAGSIPSVVSVALKTPISFIEFGIKKVYKIHCDCITFVCSVNTAHTECYIFW